MARREHWIPRPACPKAAISNFHYDDVFGCILYKLSKLIRKKHNSWIASMPQSRSNVQAKSRSVPPSPARHQPQYQDIALYFPILCDQVAVGPHEGFWYAGKSTMPWFVASCVCHSMLDQDQFRRPTRERCARTASWKYAETRECGC